MTPPVTSGMTPALPLLSIEHLNIALPRGGDRTLALDDVSIALQAGEILCVVGESGSGKSMLANAVMGLLPDYLTPTQGRIMYQSQDLLTLAEPALRALRGASIGMVFQEPLSALNPVMRVGEQIGEVFRVHGMRDARAVDAKVLELLEYVGLPDPDQLKLAYPFRLSGGQRQRVMIAMALALEPSVLIADEPTTALDVTTQAQILELIRSIQRRKKNALTGGMGVLFITHDFGVVAEIADRVAVMEKGKVVEVGLAQSVLNAPSHPYTRRLIAAVPHRPSAGSAFNSGVSHQERAQVLEVKKLSKTYRSPSSIFGKRREVHAVKSVSFTLNKGETLGIVGESGSGKSTVGKCLTRLIDAESGSIVFRGQNLNGLSASAFRPLRKHLQMIFQDPFASLNPRQNVSTILTDGPVAHGEKYASALSRAVTLLQLVGLDPGALHRFPNEFSGGQRQRIGIARALMLEPEIIVADEAVSALDVSVQAQVLVLLKDIQRRLDLSLIFITHDLRVAAQLCDRVAVMHRGAIVELGSAAQIFEDPKHPYTQSLIAAIPGKGWVPPAVLA